MAGLRDFGSPRVGGHHQVVHPHLVQQQLSAAPKRHKGSAEARNGTPRTLPPVYYDPPIPIFDVTMLPPDRQIPAPLLRLRGAEGAAPPHPSSWILERKSCTKKWSVPPSPPSPRPASSSRFATFCSTQLIRSPARRGPWRSQRGSRFSQATARCHLGRASPRRNLPGLWPSSRPVASP